MVTNQLGSDIIKVPFALVFDFVDEELISAITASKSKSVSISSPKSSTGSSKRDGSNPNAARSFAFF